MDDLKEEIAGEINDPGASQGIVSQAGETVEELKNEKTAEGAQPAVAEEKQEETKQEQEAVSSSEQQEAVEVPAEATETASETVAENVQSEVVAENIQPLQEPKWYIVQTLTGQEEKVKERIEGNVEALNLKEKVLRVLLPEEETVEIKGDKRIVRKRKMYPGYVFVEMRLDEDAWYKIRSTTGVARFIGGKTTPQPVTDREMQRVLKQMGIKEKEIKVEFEVGEPIRIISGSFRGYTGSVSEVIASKSKLKAMINIFGRDTSVEVDFDRVEKVI